MMTQHSGRPDSQRMSLSLLALICFTSLKLCYSGGSAFDECELVLNSRKGLNVFNCSDINLDFIPEELPPEADILDFSYNDFTTLPVLPESSECHDACGVEDDTNHCRIHISFSNNDIDDLERNPLSELRCLESLDLSYNDISDEDLYTELFERGGYYIQNLNLRGNPLGTLPDNVITHPFMPFLRDLDLGMCELSEIGRTSVDDLGNLRRLNLSYNHLHDIHQDAFKGLKQLEELDLTKNHMSYFSEHIFGDLINLKELKLSGNKIEDFHKDAFYDDSRLEFLDLTNNQLKFIPYTVVSKLRNLETLVLSQNPIKALTQSENRTAVAHLVLDNMPLLEEIKTGDLESFPILISLSISGSKALTKIEPGVLGTDAPFLRSVSVANAWLTTLDEQAFPWQQLDSLKVVGNPWVCDERIEWMIQAPCITDPVICAAPYNLKGQDLRSLAPSELKREVPVFPTAGIVILLLAIPVIGACAVFSWRRRRFCACPNFGGLKGRYNSVFMKDVDEEREEQLERRIEEGNAKRIVTISNGDGGSDSKHLVTNEANGTSAAAAAEDDDEEEEI